MDLSSRYEILDTIATGDFATVYRARDRELGREVAIKQIHQQFLADEQQLARYWQEAQLLASLQHPNVLTIYDIVRPRGWLILELARGSLKEQVQRGPIDLDFLRVVLSGSLHALHFLHANGVIHGDVKPSNLLIDARGQVKLGDFGLARRASNEEGSLLKGTTKYMAPELLSNLFGAVGPASDLYSLGFAAFELMCGPQFETLFPSLSSFGRDKQIAWMMWHAAADQQLPAIGRVLEGVPDELARVVQRLVAKDQNQRYRSAREVLGDLQRQTPAVDELPEEEDAEAMAAREAEAKRKRRLRLGAIAAMIISLVVCVPMLLPPRQTKGPTGPPEPLRGVISNVYPDEWKLALALSANGSAREISLTRHDQILVNDVSVLLRDLRSEDQVVVEQIVDKEGRRVKKISAYRPEIDTGRVKIVRAAAGEFALSIEEGDRKGDELLVSVGAGTKILLNGSEQIGGQAVRLGDLQMDDRVVVHHLGGEMGRVATELRALRVVETTGKIRGVDAKKGEFSLEIDGEAKPRKMPWAPDCTVTINDRAIMNEKALMPADLQPGDEVTVAHDTQAVRVDAYRTLGEAGVIENVLYADRMLRVVPEGGGAPITYTIGPECKITLGGEAVELAELRGADAVDVTHDMPGAKSPEAKTIAARRPSDPARWAILIANQDYDDKTLSPLRHPAGDAELLSDVLTKRYRVASGQAQLFEDASRVRLRQAIPEWLGRAGADAKLVLYFGGHAYQDTDGTVYLAPKDFDLKQMKTTGLSLQWLIDQLEQCPAKEKLLLLDCSHVGQGADLASQPSTAEMLQTLKAPPGRAALRTVTAVASCRAGQRGFVRKAEGEAKEHGLFAWLLAEGYSGDADKNRDGQLEPTELFAYLNESMASASAALGAEQGPQLFLADNRPPRLSEQAKRAIRALAALLRQDPIDVDAAAEPYAAAEQSAGKEVEPRLLYGLLLLKAKAREQALAQFEQVRIEHPRLLLPMQAIAWVQFETRNYDSGMNELRNLVDHIPKPRRATDSYPEPSRRLFHWAGQLREFAAVAPQPRNRPPAQLLADLDSAVAKHGSQAVQSYEEGRSASRSIAMRFDQQIQAGDPNPAKLRVDRRQLGRYVQFPFGAAAAEILAGLDK